MKISDVIQRLQNFKKEYGDLPVWYNAPYFSYGEITERSIIYSPRELIYMSECPERIIIGPDD